MHVDRARDRRGVVAPDFVEQLVAGQDGAAVLDEVAKQLDLERRELDRRPFAPHLGAAKVDVNGAESVGIRGVRGHGPRAAQQRFDARQQLHHLERLGQIVVGAEFQADDAVYDLAARGEHQDRRLNAALAEIAADVEAVLPRKGDVEDDQVERRARARSQRRFTVALDRDYVALRLETVAQREDEALFVFDQQNAALQFRHAAQSPAPLPPPRGPEGEG